MNPIVKVEVRATPSWLENLSRIRSRTSARDMPRAMRRSTIESSRIALMVKCSPDMVEIDVNDVIEAADKGELGRGGVEGVDSVGVHGR